MTLRVLVTSSTFPQYEADPRGGFIVRHWQRRARDRQLKVRVVAPRTRWSDPALSSISESANGAGDELEIRRFGYAPRRASSLTGRFGILENIRERPYRVALVIPYLWAHARFLRREIASFRPDRVVAHMLIPHGLACVAEARRAGIPVELYGHGTDVDIMLMLSRVLGPRVLRPLLAADRVCFPSAEKLQRVTAALGREQAPGNFSVEYMADAMREKAAANRFNRDRIELGAREEARVLFMGRLIRQKGVDLLLEAVSGLEPRPRVEIAGDGPERARLERLAAQLGLEVRFHGFVDSVRRDALYDRASLLCVPSRAIGMLGEGAPLVVVEARSRGLPVVASSIGGIPELCDGDVDSVLVPPNDARALAQAIAPVIAARATL